MNRQVFHTICGISTFVALMSVVSIAAESATPELRFENHHYVPQTLTVPAGQPVTIKVINASKETIDDILVRIKANPGDKGFMPFKHDKLSDSLINVFVKWKSDGLAEK